MKAMVHFRFTSLLLVLFLSALALIRVSFALAHRELTRDTNHDQASERNQEFLQEIETSATTQRQGIRGRKMGLKDGMKKDVTEARSTVSTGMSKTSSRKPCGSSNTKDTSNNTLESCPTTPSKGTRGSALGPMRPSSIDNSLESSKGSKASTSHNPFQTTDPHKLIEVAAELSKILNKDYHESIRRHPPIHNDLPLEDNDVEP